MKCKIAKCSNPARYYALLYNNVWLLIYCGLHDLDHNRGKGKRAVDLAESDMVATVKTTSPGR